MLPVVLTDLGLATTLAGIAAAIKPLRWLHLRTRRRAVAILLAGLLLTGIALLLPAPTRTIREPSTLLDAALPDFQFHEVHAIAIDAAPDRVHRAIKEVTADEIRFFRTLVWLRRFGRPLPESILSPSGQRPLLEVATTTTFTMLADTPREVLVGTVVAAPPGYERPQPPTPGEFLSLRGRPGFALAAMTFLVTPRPDGTCEVSTETRVWATDPPTRRRFGAYWRVIYPGSATIRRMWLRAIRERAERAR